jgi:hypothetical protein
MAEERDEWRSNCIEGSALRELFEALLRRYSGSIKVRAHNTRLLCIAGSTGAYCGSIEQGAGRFFFFSVGRACFALATRLL